MIVGFVLRFSISVIHSYSSDELSAINRLNYESIDQMIEKGVKHGDFHPAGVQIFEKFWSSLFGTSEVALRFPFVIFGLLSILLIYIIGKTYSSKKSGIIAATLLTVTYFPTLFSELARPYSPGLFFVLLSSWFYLKFFFQNSLSTRSKFTNVLCLGISLALTMYTHYFAFMFVGFMGLVGLFFIKKKNIIPYLLSGVLALLLFSPHFEITLYHLGIEGGLGWLGRPHKLWFFDFLFYAFNDSITFVILIVSSILFSVLASSKTIEVDQKIKKSNLIFILWFFGIYIVAFLFSYVSSPILKYPVMLFPLPFFFLILGSFFTRLDSKKFNLIFAAILIFGSASTLYEKDLLGNQHYGLMEEIAEPMVNWRAEFGQENIVSYMNINNPNYLNFYAIPLGDSLTFDKHVLEFDEDENIRKELLEDERPYCIVGYSTRPTSPQILETCMEFYPHILAHHQFNNSAVILLSKNKKDGMKELHQKTIGEFDVNHLNNRWKINSAQIRTNYYLSDSISKYGPSFTFKLADIGFETSLKNNYYFKISIDADAITETELTATITASRNSNRVTDNYNEPIWIGKDIEKMLLNPKDNNPAYFAFNLPKEFKPKDDIQISLWNRNGEPIKIYCIKVEIIEDIF